MKRLAVASRGEGPNSACRGNIRLPPSSSVRRWAPPSSRNSRPNAQRPIDRFYILTRRSRTQPFTRERPSTTNSADVRPISTCIKPGSSVRGRALQKGLRVTISRHCICASSWRRGEPGKVTGPASVAQPRHPRRTDRVDRRRRRLGTNLPVPESLTFEPRARVIHRRPPARLGQIHPPDQPPSRRQGPQ